MQKSAGDKWSEGRQWSRSGSGGGHVGVLVGAEGAQDPRLFLAGGGGGDAAGGVPDGEAGEGVGGFVEVMSDVALEPADLEAVAVGQQAVQEFPALGEEDGAVGSCRIGARQGQVHCLDGLGA